MLALPAVERRERRGHGEARRRRPRRSRRRTARRGARRPRAPRRRAKKSRHGLLRVRSARVRTARASRRSLPAREQEPRREERGGPRGEGVKRAAEVDEAGKARRSRRARRRRGRARSTRPQSSRVGRTVLGPSSSRKPSRRSVRTTPPGAAERLEDAHVLAAPARARSAAARPESPPPTTTVRPLIGAQKLGLRRDDLGERAQERRPCVQARSPAEIGDAGRARLVAEELVDLVERLDVIGHERDRDREHLLLRRGGRASRITSSVGGPSHSTGPSFDW